MFSPWITTAKRGCSGIAKPEPGGVRSRPLPTMKKAIVLPSGLRVPIGHCASTWRELKTMAAGPVREGLELVS